MENTQMWKEIHDQPQVAKRLLEEYLPKAKRYHQKLTEKRQLVLTGMGASLYACQMAKYAFYLHSGLKPLVTPAEDLPYLLPSFDRETLVIFVSQSGESIETKLYGEKVKETGAELWGITNEPDSSLGRNASEVLPLYCEQEVSSATKTNLATVLLLTILAFGWKEEYQQKFYEIPEKLEKTLKQADTGLDLLVNTLLTKENFYILGAGLLGAAAIEGALMMQEKTFLHTMGSSIGDFRHGTLEVTEKGLPVLFLASGGKQARETQTHIRFLENIGADIYLITDCGKYCHPCTEHRILIEDAGEECFAPLYFLVPLQLLAEQTARRKGLEVDGFRYLSKVVKDYDGRKEA